MERYELKLDAAKSLADIFEVVKDGVRMVMRTGRAGLTLGLAELGGGEDYWVGAFYPLGSNTIIMNKVPLRRIAETAPRLYNAYAFHVLLHEYLHSLGYIEEQEARHLVLWISRELFGEEHVVTQMAKSITRFLPNLTYPGPGSYQKKLEELEIEMVPDFDRSSVTYIV